MEKVSAVDRVNVLSSGLKRARLKEFPSVRGEFTVIVRDAETLKVLETFKVENVITNGGLGVFASRCANPWGGAEAVHRWRLALGTGSGTPSSSDTALFNEISASRKGGSVSVSGSSYQYYVRYLPEEANGYTYTEAGIFENTDADGSDGTLINHIMLSPPLSKDASILVDFYITITFS